MDTDFPFELNPLSVVFDIGGYRGDFTDMIREKYKCGVHIFDPSKQWFSHIIKRFEKDPMIWPYQVALEDENKDGMLFVHGNSNSLYWGDGEKEEIRIRDIFFFIQAFKLSRVDLMKINCEGSEYKILDQLIAKKWIQHVKNLVIQFHHIEGRDRETYIRELTTSHDCKHRCDHWQWWRVKQ